MHWHAVAAALLSLAVCRGFEQATWEAFQERGATLQKQGRMAEAKAAYLEAHAIAQSFSKDDARRAHSLNCLCSVNYELGLRADAERFCARALSEGSSETEEARLNAFNSLHVLVALNLQSGQNARAGQLVERMQKLFETLPGGPVRLRGILLYDRAFLELTANHLAEAQDKFLQASECFRQNESDANVLATALSHVSNVLIRRRRFLEAEGYAREALSVLTTRYGPDHPETVRDNVNLSRVYLNTGRPEEAVALLRHALSTAESAFGADDPMVGVVLETYAAVLKQLRRKAEAKDMERRAAAIARRVEENNTGRYTIDARALSPRRR